MTRSSASDAAPTMNVTPLVSGIALIVPQSCCMYEPSTPGTPSSEADWSITIPIAKPSVKPDMTAFDRKVEIQPMRSRPSAM